MDELNKQKHNRGSELKDLLIDIELDIEKIGSSGMLSTKKLINITKNLYNENTVLIDSLCGMCEQYLKETYDGELMHHDFMSAGEYTFKILEQIGIVEEVNGSFKFIKDGLGLRKIC